MRFLVPLVHRLWTQPVQFMIVGGRDAQVIRERRGAL